MFTFPLLFITAKDLSLIHCPLFSARKLSFNISGSSAKSGFSAFVYLKYRIILKIYLYLLLELGGESQHERAHAQVGGQRRKESISSRLCIEYRAWHTAWSHNPVIMTWAKTKSRTLNWLCHPSALMSLFLQQTHAYPWHWGYTACRGLTTT